MKAGDLLIYPGTGKDIGKKEQFQTRNHGKAKWKKKFVTAIAKSQEPKPKPQNPTKHCELLSANCAINIMHDVATSTEKGKRGPLSQMFSS